MDLASFGPLVGSLIRAGSPAIAGVITLALTPEIGPLAGLVGGGVGDILPRIATALGAPADSTADQLAATVNADPNAAQKALAKLEADHKFILSQQKQTQDFNLGSQAQQVAIDTVEAQGQGRVERWARPAMLWGLGGLLMLSSSLPYLVWALVNIGIHLTPPPTLDITSFGLLSALLGVTVVTPHASTVTTASKKILVRKN